MNNKVSNIITAGSMALAVVLAVMFSQWLFDTLNRPCVSADTPYVIPQDIRLSDGSIYCGQLRDGVPHGCGVKSFPDDVLMAGTWTEGVPHGLFRERDRFGQVQYWLWEEGRRERFLDISAGKDLYGIDISHYQDICWGATCVAMNSDGRRSSESVTGCWKPVDFVFMKATEGMTMVDPVYAHHQKMAKRLHIPQGAYHVMQLGVPALSQAFHFCAHVSPWDCELPPVLDLEAQYFGKTLSATSARDELLLWLDFVERYFKKRPLIYTSRNFYWDYIEGTDLDTYPIWLADYSSRPDADYATIRQISCKGVVSGWEKKVDIDKILVPYDACSSVLVPLLR